MTLDQPETRLDEHDRTEWRDVCAILRPDWTDEDFDAAWDEFAEMKRRRAMTKREEAIEAMARAIADNIEGCTPEMAHYPATAAFDAAVKVLSEPDEEMIAEGFESIRMEEKWPTLMGRVFKAMLKAAAL